MMQKKKKHIWFYLQDPNSWRDLIDKNPCNQIFISVYRIVVVIKCLLLEYRTSDLYRTVVLNIKYICYTSNLLSRTVIVLAFISSIIAFESISTVRSMLQKIHN